MTKQLTIEQAVSTIEDGSLLALGGNALQRSPIAFVKELIKQNKQNLSVIKTAGALDVDLLAGAKSLREVFAGYVGFEMLGLAPQYRRGVQSGEIIAREHACASVIAGLRASIYGVPFQPINGFQGSDIPELTGLIKQVTCPFTGEKTQAVQALTPDVTVLHANIADEKGNAFIAGPTYEDLIMLKAAKRVFVTAEKVIPADEWHVSPQIQGFLVNGVIEVKNGAVPGSCPGDYPIHVDGVKEYLQNPQAFLESVKGSEQYA